ncbi:MAG: TolB protein [Gaiellaceae bacterium]|nr:TolB protein [Gaiellaceae bacterium]
MRGPGSIVFVAGGRTVGFGVDNKELVAATPSGRLRDLTSSPTSEYGATWSPDGSRVLFFRRPATMTGTGADAEQPGFYVWVPGGGPPQRIASCSYYCHWYSFAWSPDNRRIAFVSEGGYAAIEVMNADCSGLHTVCGVKRCGQGVGEPRWSPDGRRLIFNISGGWPSRSGYIPPGAIWIANADGSGVRQLTQPNCRLAMPESDSRGCAVDTGPVWSPNGQLIAFYRSDARIPWLPQVTGPARLPGIEIMRPDGSHLHRISTCRGSADYGCYMHFPLAWAPDSKSVAYTPATSDHPSSFRISTLAGKTTTIRTCVVAGSGCLSPYQLTWSPNGERLAFVSRKGTNASIWVIGRDGDRLHRVSRGGACCLAWVRNDSLSG